MEGTLKILDCAYVADDVPKIRIRNSSRGIEQTFRIETSLSFRNVVGTVGVITAGTVEPHSALALLQQWLYQCCIEAR